MMSRKSQRNMTTKKDADANLNFPLGTPIEEILNLTLRDMILETEEKIFMGMLGSIRTENREAWREAIAQRTYVRDTELDFGGRKRIAQIKSELGLEVSDDADTEDLPQEAEERMTTVKDLAEAILLLGQSVDAKYLTQPLGETEKARKRRERAEGKLRRKSAKRGSGDEGSANESDEDEDEEGEEGKTSRVTGVSDVTDNALRTPMERWEKSLMASTNLSQLCLHYATLDNSITWSRSALNARCRICRRKTDAENMLLCDGCDKGYHMHCLKPKIKSIPSGDWFCDKCKPKEKPKSPRKKNRQIYKEEDSDVEEEGSGEEEDSDSGSEASPNEDKCFVCAKSEGTLICCDTCPLSFHQECASLRKVPRGFWSCRQCNFPPEKKEKRVLPPKKKKSNKENEKNKENKKVKDNNKENKEKKKNATKAVSTKKESPKNNIKEKTSNKSRETEKSNNKSNNKATEEKKKRKSDVVVTDNLTPTSKKLKLAESEINNTPSKRSRRSLVDEDCELNSPALETVLEELLKHPLSWPFAKPVSKKDAPDYYNIVKKPMDFRTIQGKLYDMKYSKDDEFIADVMLVFQNCQQYNMEEAEEYKAGKAMSKHFTKRLKELGLNYQAEKKQAKKKKH